MSLLCQVCVSYCHHTGIDVGVSSSCEFIEKSKFLSFSVIIIVIIITLISISSGNVINIILLHCSYPEYHGVLSLSVLLDGDVDDDFFFLMTLI